MHLALPVPRFGSGSAGLGYLIAPIYLVFLALLMAALVAKLGFMAREGYQVVPAIIVIPLLLLVSTGLSVTVLRTLRRS